MVQLVNTSGQVLVPVGLQFSTLDGPYRHAPGNRHEPVSRLKALGRAERALEAALYSDAIVRRTLVDQCGFSVHQVKYSNDMQTLYVLWDCYPGRVTACDAALRQVVNKIRRKVADNLRAKRTPFIEFRHDRLPEAAVVREQVFAKATRDLDVPYIPDPLIDEVIADLEGREKT